MNAKASGQIEIHGAREHNLKNIDLNIPRNALVVITGLSGSGKSSLAFDTIFAEGQRRYIETFSAYARQFIGNLQRPDVDKIDGLSPVIAIEQKTTVKNPRSTVGTTTEIYDFLRLLFARAADAFSYVTNQKMVSYTDEEIAERIIASYQEQKIYLLAPVIRSRKGHYKELFEQMAKKGYLKARIDGKITEISKGLKLDRYKIHDIELVIDQLKVLPNDDFKKRIIRSLNNAMKEGEGSIMILPHEGTDVRYFSKHLMCAESGISYALPEPNTFSFNSPKGACEACNGLGTKYEVAEDKIFPDPKKSIKNGAIAPHASHNNQWLNKQLEAIAVKFGFSLTEPFEKIPNAAKETLLYGGKDSFSIAKKELGVTKEYQYNFEGIIPFLEKTLTQNDTPS
ncbi:MAG: excinuclease ABC subunit UvrA, partial [Flavobacteriaceae bacterium]|nr:excinuclease ABC subunit UvrA [Flavobacteriaceae bacterium]